jgi:hypothetical protein
MYMEWQSLIIFRGLDILQQSPCSTKCSTGNYSTDDLDWLCNWGGVPLLQWEKCGMHESEPCVISHVQYWIQKEHQHIFISNARISKQLPPMNDAELAVLHSAMTEELWTRAAVQRRHALFSAHESMQQGRLAKRPRVSFADALFI